MTQPWLGSLQFSCLRISGTVTQGDKRTEQPSGGISVFLTTRDNSQELNRLGLKETDQVSTELVERVCVNTVDLQLGLTHNCSKLCINRTLLLLLPHHPSLLHVTWIFWLHLWIVGRKWRHVV